MKLYGVTDTQLRDCLNEANKRYKGNLTFNYVESHRSYVQFTMRVKDSHLLGARLGQSGRHITAACWHAHRDLMRVIFDRFPEAKLVSAQARYDGVEGFAREFEATGYKNIGSMMYPVYYMEACECTR